MFHHLSVEEDIDTPLGDGNIFTFQPLAAFRFEEDIDTPLGDGNLIKMFSTHSRSLKKIQIPRQGTETHIKVSLQIIVLLKKIQIPRQGTETHERLRNAIVLEKKIQIPRQGTETGYRHLINPRKGEEDIDTPLGDGNTKKLIIRIFITFEEDIDTPLGDGNNISACSLFSIFEEDIDTPLGDGNLHAFCVLCSVSKKIQIPRQGTETFRVYLLD